MSLCVKAEIAHSKQSISYPAGTGTRGELAHIAVSILISMFIISLLCCGRFNSKVSLLSHSQLQEEEVAENCFLEQDSRKTRNMNMQNFLTRMNSKSKFFKFLGDNHKSGLPDPSVDHPLAPSGKNQTHYAAAPM